jgi:hypothetical protein
MSDWIKKKAGERRTKRGSTLFVMGTSISYLRTSPIPPEHPALENPTQHHHTTTTTTTTTPQNAPLRNPSQPPPHSLPMPDSRDLHHSPPLQHLLRPVPLREHRLPLLLNALRRRRRRPAKLHHRAPAPTGAREWSQAGHDRSGADAHLERACAAGGRRQCAGSDSRGGVHAEERGRAAR